MPEKQEPIALSDLPKKLDPVKIHFSTRSRITHEAQEWCDNLGIPQHPFNIVTALAALGYLDKDKTHAD